MNLVSMAFTLHFATINTLPISEDWCPSYSFTLHFATINT